jgi:hypothetical protein
VFNVPRIRNILALVLQTGPSTCYPAKVKHRLEPNLEHVLGWNENDDDEGRNRPRSRVFIVSSQLSHPLAFEKAKDPSPKQRHLRKITVTSQAHIVLHTFLRTKLREDSTPRSDGNKATLQMDRRPDYSVQFSCHHDQVGFTTFA